MRLLEAYVIWRVLKALVLLAAIGAVAAFIYHVFPPAREVMDTMGHAWRLFWHYIDQHLKGLT